ncbi:hypothetical protein [Embleya sp. MST-111070]|uniref:hypothetical protein n=1 Tax=Embleya sp. MST-111070 TaxID=3398231 RepID=UPI003F73760C
MVQRFLRRLAGPILLAVFAAVLTAAPAQAAPDRAQVRQVSSASTQTSTISTGVSTGVHTLADASARTTTQRASVPQLHPTKKTKKKKKGFFKKAGKFIFAIIGIIVLAIILYFVWRALKRRS